MRRLTKMLVLGAVVVLALALAVPGSAITNGDDDGELHPSVGGLVADQAYSDGTWIYCSGTLISPTVFLTAAHCGEDGDSVRVTFDTAYSAPGTTYAGTFIPDPAYTFRQSDPHDIAVVVLSSPITDIPPALLPEPGSLSDLQRRQSFTSVGYGAYDVVNGPGGKAFLYNDVRMYSIGHLITVNKAWLRISMNPARGDGGTCYGDSGGPNFVGNTNVIGAITITGDAVCRATNVVYRLDTPSAQTFLNSHLP